LKNLLRHLFVLLGCLHLIGGPNAILQVYAWANMLVSYSQESSFSQAVTDTFSGEKPCGLCEKIATSKSAEKERDNAPLPPGSPKLFQDLFPPTLATLKDTFPSPFPQPAFLTGNAPLSPPASGPPVPPPRC
jgi:hypothetical protein